jgi:hypothetical protein
MPMTMGAYNAVRVADLEVAMVLAREFKSASGSASLTLGQLQAVFGAAYLDSHERERIAAALEAAGLHTEPSVLDAHPDEPLLFTVNGKNGKAKPEPNGERRFMRQLPAPAAAAEKTAPATAPQLPTTAIVLGILLPVLFTSVAGWRFGLSFVAFTASAAGFLSRSDPAAIFRSGRTFLAALGGLCLLSLLGAVALAGGGSKQATTTQTPKATTTPRPVVAPPRAATRPTTTTPKATNPPRRKAHVKPPRPAKTPPTSQTPTTTAP